jgi:hypothetical protein
MSEATSGIFVPAYRFAHAGYITAGTPISPRLYKSATNSSTVIPACAIIPRNVPRFRSPA